MCRRININLDNATCENCPISKMLLSTINFNKYDITGTVHERKYNLIYLESYSTNEENYSTNGESKIVRT